MQTPTRLLVLASLALAAGCTSATAPVVDATAEPVTHHGAWFWLGSTSAAGTLTVADPARYQIDLVDDGTMQVRADCNRGRGSYTLASPAQFAVGPIGMTKMGCAPDSQDRDFLAQLSAGGALDVHTDWLRIDGADGRSMVFTRSAQAPLVSFDCATGGSFIAAFGRGTALVLVDGGRHILPQVATASGIRYADGAMQLDSKGDVAMLGGAAVERRDCRSGAKK